MIVDSALVLSVYKLFYSGRQGWSLPIVCVLEF